MDMEKRLRDVMDRSVEERQIAGMNLLVKRDGQEICYCQCGLADREKGRAFSRDTILRLFSQTKPVTAAAAMILMERGMVDIQQPVEDFLPEFAGQQVLCEQGCRASRQQMTVKDLLHMTSGLAYPHPESAAGRYADSVYAQANRRLRTENPMTTRELAARLAQGPLEFEPGSSWQYGASADVLGALIEAATGRCLAGFMEEEIFAPLGMEDTGFWVVPKKQERLAVTYETVRREDGKNDLIPYGEDHLGIQSRMEREPALASGGAGLASTLDDYMRFAEMLLGEGQRLGVRILRPATVRFLTGGQLSAVQQEPFHRQVGLEGYSYANLMRVCKNPARAGTFTTEGEYGWDGWLGVYFANFPKEKLTILMGMQAKDGCTFPLARKLRNVVVGSLC